MTAPDDITITYDGTVAAIAGPTAFVLAPAIAALPVAHPTTRVVAFMCAFARGVLAGELPGPYSDAAAERFARWALIDPAILAAHPRATNAQLAELVGVPLQLLADARDELEHTTGNLAGDGTPAYLRRVPSRREALRQLWSMTPAQRVAAMRRGELELELCFAWAARHPSEIPTVDGVLEFLAGAELGRVTR